MTHCEDTRPWMSVLRNASGASAQFIFLPGVPIQLGTLLPMLMGADALGALLGWRYLDHLGHLGGAAFGRPQSALPSTLMHSAHAKHSAEADFCLPHSLANAVYVRMMPGCVTLQWCYD